MQDVLIHLLSPGLIRELRCLDHVLSKVTVFALHAIYYKAIVGKEVESLNVVYCLWLGRRDSS